MENALTCPLTLDRFVEPVQVECCSRTFSRAALAEWLRTNATCPLCRATVTSAKPNRTVQDVLDADNVAIATLFEEPREAWQVSLSVLTDGTTSQDTITQVKVRCNDKQQLKARKSVMVLAMDGSGSMGGNPATQVKFALQATLDLAQQCPGTKVYTVGYDHKFYLDVGPDQVQTNGGTSFGQAFEGIRQQLLKAKREVPEAASASIVFMTDGADGSGRGLPGLQEDLRAMLRADWSLPVTVHTVGFGSGASFNVLDTLRKCGTSEGAYRFADPTESQDALYQKMCALIQPILKASSTPVTLSFDNSLLTARINLNNGLGQTWIVGPAVTGESIVRCTITQENSTAAEAGTTVNATARLTCSVDVWTQWYSKLTDDLIAETLDLNDKRYVHAEDVRLYATLLKQRSLAVLRQLRKPPPDASERIEDPEPIIERLERTQVMIETLMTGTALDTRAATDLKYASQYGGKVAPMMVGASMPQRAVPKQQPALAFQQAPKPMRANEYLIPAYAFVQNHTRYWGGDQIFRNVFCGQVNDPTNADMTARDDNGNTLLHVAASCGKHRLVSQFPITNVCNNVGETALDLAVVNGWWKCADCLYERGQRPALDPQTLLLACVTKGRLKTADWLLDKGLAHVNQEICERAPHGYTNWCTQRVAMKPEDQVKLALKKGLVAKLKEVWEHVPTILWEDHLHLLEARDHAEMVELLVDGGKADVMQTWEVEDHEGDLDTRWPLHVAAVGGGEATCQVLLAHMTNEQINFRSKVKGKTALWAACVRNHPDVVMALLDAGADPDIQDHKGDTALMAACQKGSVVNAQLLLNAGADINLHDPARDSAALVCSRSGKHEILDLLIKRTHPDERPALFAQFAEIDGFSLVPAAAEMDQADCLRVLHRYGANMDVRTADDNAILGGATAVHLACFYGRLKALEALKQCGCNFVAPTTTDRKTPLHIAVEKGQVQVVGMLMAMDVPLDVRDSSGRTPAFYAAMEGNEAIYQQYFFNPLVPLLKRLITDTTRRDLSDACTILREHGTSPGCFDSHCITNLDCGHGLTPLTLAVLSHRTELVDVFRQMGASLDTPDHRGMTPAFWLALQQGDQSHPQVARITEVAQRDLQNPMLLDVPQQIPALMDLPTSLAQAMELGYAVTSVKATANDLLASRRDKLLSLTQKLSKLVGTHGEQLLWEAKVHLVSQIAQGGLPEGLTPAHLLGLFLYTGDTTIAAQVNEALISWSVASPWMPLASVVGQALSLLPPFVGECYRRVNQPLPEDLWSLQSELCWPTFVNATADWTQVADNGQTKGIVFIIQSKSSRHLNRYTRAAQNNPVVFLPGTRFMVKAYYKFHVTALGQANIRDSTFPATEEEIQKAKEGRRNIMVALEEI